MVKSVKTELTLCCSDGSRCVMSDVDASKMDDVLVRRGRASMLKKYGFYPGQQLRGPYCCFQNVKWLTPKDGSKLQNDMCNAPNKSYRTTVEDVKVVSLGVRWACKAYSEENFCNQDSEKPKYHVSGEDLKSIKMVNFFEPCTIQIGVRNCLMMKEGYEVISLHEWKNRMAGCLNLHSSSSSLKLGKVAKQRVNSTCTDESEEGDNLEGEANSVEHGNGDADEWEYEDSEKSSDASSVTSHSTVSSAETRSSASKRKRIPHYATKMKIRSVRRRAMRHVMKDFVPIQSMEKIVTEALITETKAHVVWQDGTVEYNVLSTSLYPVHHSDSNEFFPGDYVIENSKDGLPYEYGVVKQVDHTGRTAQVTWMKAYHSGGNPHPEVLTEQEVSVYDIKYHPYFYYRPRDWVIRLVNSEDSWPSSTAGQVVDVHSTGKVEVYWVNGETSLCYPQELYRVGKYIFEDLWVNVESLSDEDSCKTKLEIFVDGLDDGITEKDNDVATKDVERISIKFGDKNEEKSKEGMQEKLLANIEKLQASTARLEVVFTQNPTLQTDVNLLEVMRRLLGLHKHCKVLDQLLGTTYFHERHLQSLVERLKPCGFGQVMGEVMYHLFSSGEIDPYVTEDPIDPTLNESSKVDINILIESPGDNSSSLNNKDADSPTSKDENSMSLPSVNCNKEEAQQQKSKPLVSPTSGGGINALNCKLDVEFCGKVALLSPVSSTSGGGADQRHDICQQLCAILKSRLLKAHEDAEQHFGMPRSKTSALLDKQLATVEQEKPPDEGVACKENSDPVVEAVPEENTAGLGVFSMLESVPDNHNYKLSIYQPLEPCAFFRVVKKEMDLLKSSLPKGIIVKGFEDRIDLYSVLIKGPKRTAYEDSLFFFDFQLPADYPKSPPLCHYISYCNDRLNPNLYEGGKVCVSLLGTWEGKGTEMWNPASSNLLQVIVSIQGLILVAEPYYNEPGFECEKGTQLGMENSRMYNEMVVLKCVQSMAKLLVSPPAVFKDEIKEHFKSQFSKLVQRLEKWLEISESWNSTHPTSPVSPTSFKEVHSQSVAQEVSLPEFPLIPASKGFCLSLRKSLEDIKSTSASFFS